MVFMLLMYVSIQPLNKHFQVFHYTHYYGGSVSFNTVSCCRSELPREQYEGLRVELFSAIARSSGGAPRLVLVQLCRCLVAFAFATVPDIWPNTVVSMVHTLREVTRSLQVSSWNPTHFQSTILSLVCVLLVCRAPISHLLYYNYSLYYPKR